MLMIKKDDILVFSAVRNEIIRLPYFLDYYRRLGVAHFLFVDNASDDGTAAYLAQQHDVSVWHTSHSYRLSRFGVDWLGWLKFRYGHGHWCLTVDADELLVFPKSENRSLTDLTRHLDVRDQLSFGALMIDLYPKGPIGDQPYAPGQNPTEVMPWFDATGYWTQPHAKYKNQWIQGGPRARKFFAQSKQHAPTLNKVPLVKWSRRFAYINSTHQILPTKLHEAFDPRNLTQMSGALLHTKFLPQIISKSKEELERKQHFANSDLYRSYHETLSKSPNLWFEESVAYTGTDQLVALGLISNGNTNLG